MSQMLVLLFFTGAAVGSFLNVLVDVLTFRRGTLFGRSYCDSCKRQLCWYELIPIASWILQMGKSRCCKKNLSVHYLLVECASGIGFVAPLLLSFDLSFFQYTVYLILFSSFLSLFISDLRSELLPTPLLLASVVASFLLMGTSVSSVSQALWLYIIPAVASTLCMFFLWFFSKGKAMGDGDIALVCAISLTIGYPRIIISLYVAFLTGALVGVILILGRKKHLKSHIPFGPFLIWGMVVAVLFAPVIIRLWNAL